MVKIDKKYWSVIFLMVLTSGCFEQPEFSDVPQIELQDFYYTEVGGIADADSIVVSFSFQDGNGDIGIPRIGFPDGTSGDDTSDPYHEKDYFLATGDGNLVRVPTETIFADTVRNGNLDALRLTVLIPPTLNGKLVTNETRLLPEYSDLPIYRDEDLGCINYTKDFLLLLKGNEAILDNDFKTKGTVLDIVSGLEFIKLDDITYFEFNPEFNNLDITLEVEGNGGVFNVFDWQAVYCENFNSRIPVISDSNTSSEGVISYALVSTGFKTVFTNKRIRIRIKIRDRDLNVSNEIVTPPFRLDDVRRN